MNGFKRSLFGFRRRDVEEAIAARDSQISGLQSATERQRAVLDELEQEMSSLSSMVLERERELRVMGERLREANECHDRSIASLDVVTSRLQEMQEQARGQATRIRMKALREAVEVSERVQALTDAQQESNGAEPHVPEPHASEAPVANGNGASQPGFYEGQVRLEIGPLGDFSQLVGFEDTVGRLGASEISVERFSEGRATLSMRLNQPVELLRELEELSTLDFKVRHTAPDNLILDIDEDQGPEQRAA
jgi:hypothetical protein